MGSFYKFIPFLIPTLMVCMETLYKNKTLINLKLATPAVIQPYIVSMLFVKHADWLLLIMLKLNLGPTKQYEF